MSRIRHTAVSLAALMMFCGSAVYAGGLQYLRLPTFARAEGMGGAYTGIAQDAGAIFYNPAGLAREARTDYFFTAAYTDWIEGSKKGSSVFIFPAEIIPGGIIHALTIDYFTVSDLDLMDEFGTRQGKMTYYDVAVGLNIGKRIGEITAGANLKYLSENIAGDTGYGFSTDLGVLYTFSRNLQLGASVNNIGFFSLEDDSVEMPRTFRIGTGFTMPDMFMVGIDLEMHGAGNNVHIGTEIDFGESFKGRIGWVSSAGGGSYTIGGGFNSPPPDYSDWGGQTLINYSFTGGGNLETVNHRIDAAVRFSIF